ncbi:MAG TPA: DUF58 domain-containing protein [Verrucomicrobiae bacterium]|jgi:uncharacterized protein (DUF58 family)|nr:DUF58 domain-containing protein [Verrucomicrobiae bacterium]
MITYLLHKNYRFTSALRYWVQRKFTPAGALVIAAALLTGGIGVDTNEAIAYQTFVLLWCLLLVSMIWSLFRAPRFEARRVLPKLGTAGQPLHYQISVINPGDSTENSVTLTEDFGDPRPTYAEFANNPEPGERRRNPFDRFFRFYRWMWLMAEKQIAVSTAMKLPPLKPGRAPETEMRLQPKHRGHLRLEGFLFSISDPFGLCRSYSKCSAPDSILILPRRYALPAISLGGAAQYQPGGVTLASSIGESEEFLSVREYRRGDPLRHIHWKSTSKTGKLIVKEFQNEFFVRQALILDTFLEEASSPVFEEAVSIAASFALALNSQDSLLDLLFVGPRAFCVTAGHGVAQVSHMLEILAAVQPCTKAKFSDLEEIVLRQIALVSGSVCIFLKWDEDRKSLVEQIDSLGIPQLVLILNRPGEKNPAIRFSPGRGRFVRTAIIDASKVQEGLSKL